MSALQSLGNLNSSRSWTVVWALIALFAGVGAAAAQLGTGGTQYWDQAVVPGPNAEGFDAFGSAFASGDFNGDGFVDLAVGEPGANVNGVDSAGAVHVLYSVPPFGTFSFFRTDSFDLAQFFSSGNPAEGASFGFSLAAGDFDGDGYDDLAAGAPFDSVETSGNKSGVEDAGRVLIIYGSASDLNASDFQFLEDDQPEPFDHFGWALTAGAFNPGTRDDLTVGVPGEDWATTGPEIEDAGRVMNYLGTAGQLAFSSSTVQNAAGGTVEAFDRFGSVLAAGDLNHDDIDDRIIGVPNEDIGVLEDAGAVFVLYSGPSPADTFFSQQSLTGVAQEQGDLFGAAVAVGDFNGDGADDIAVGAPGEDLDGSDEGLVTVLLGGSSGLVLGSAVHFEQGDSAFATTEDDDAFGAALAAGDFNGDGSDELMVGAPNEDLNSETVADAGAAVLLRFNSGALTLEGTELWIQSTLANPSFIEVNDQASSTLHAADFNNDGAADFVLGAPFENDGVLVDAGAFQVFYTNEPIFEDGFESGNTAAWSSSLP